MATLLALPIARVTDANGNPVSGALLYPYLTETDTPTPVYTTAERNVAHEHPVEADANGLLPAIYLDPEVTYRFVAKTAAGAAISGMDWDPVSVSVSGDIQFTPTGEGAVTRTVAEKLMDVRSIDDFGAVGDYNPTENTGTDNTEAIQAAIDWAHEWASEDVPARALFVPSGKYLCGQITTYPLTTIYGTGRQTSEFWCKDGTTGKWWSDRGGGASKTMLAGICWYGREIEELTHIAEFGSGGTGETQFGTEGIIQSCWFRDAPNGYGLNLNSNVGIVRDVSIWSCRCNLKIVGNGNMLDGIIVYGAGLTTTGAIAGGPAAVINADISGAHWNGLHIESTATGGLPLRQNGDCSGFGTTISSSTSSTFSHLVEVDTSVYLNVWNNVGLQILGSGYTISNGLIKIGLDYFGGTSVTPRVDNFFAQMRVQGFIRLATATPASASAAGTTGSIAWDASYIYVCTATDTWKRVAISTW